MTRGSFIGGYLTGTFQGIVRKALDFSNAILETIAIIREPETL